MDALVLRCAKRQLKVSKNLAFCEDEIIGRTYGFDYQRNFRWMLIRLVGLVTVERLEKQVDQAKHDTMKSTLGTLKIVRDSAAHTSSQGDYSYSRCTVGDDPQFPTDLRWTGGPRPNDAQGRMVKRACNHQSRCDSRQWHFGCRNPFSSPVALCRGVRVS
jgi:hypothetical protein